MPHDELLSVNGYPADAISAEQAQAEMNGHRLGSGTGSRVSGAAATTVVSSISFWSTRSPVTTGNSPSAASHSGVSLSTPGMWAKL